MRGSRHEEGNFALSFFKTIQSFLKLKKSIYGNQTTNMSCSLLPQHCDITVELINT